MSKTTMHVCIDQSVFQAADISFSALGHDKAQSIIDQITSAYEQGGPPPGGFGFGYVVMVLQRRIA